MKIQNKLRREKPHKLVAHSEVHIPKNTYKYNEMKN